MIRRILILLSLLLLIYSFIPFIFQTERSKELNDLAKTYVEEAPEKLKTQNIVTAVIVTYRGLDTLGEVTVLFIATAGVGFLLGSKKLGSEKRREASEILKTGTSFLVPIIIIFGIYIFTHGHLTPGGGFQGGVVITSAFLLMMLSNTNFRFNHTILSISESLSGFTFLILAVLGLFLLQSFLDPRFLPLGKYGKLLSAGAIPVIYSFIGIKVGSELSSVLDKMRGFDL